MVKNADELGQGTQQAGSLFSQLLKLSLFAVLTGVLFYGVLSLVQPQYRSVAQLRVDQTGNTGNKLVVREIAVLNKKQLASTIIENFKLAKDPEFNVVLGRKGPLKRISIMLGISPDPLRNSTNERVLGALNERVQINKGRKSQTIDIVVRSTNAQKSARIANRYAKTYIAGLATRVGPQEKGQQESPERSKISNLQREIATTESSIAVLRDDIAVNPLIQPVIVDANREVSLAVPLNPDNAVLSEKQRFDLTSQYILARADREGAELRAKLVREMLVESGEIHSTRQVLNSGIIEDLLLKRSLLERKMADLEVSLLPSHPQLQRLDREMSALREQIKNQAFKVVANLEADAKIAAAREASLKESIDKLQDKPESIVSAIESPVQVEQPKIDERVGRLDLLQRLLDENKQRLAAAQGRLEAEVKNPVNKERAPVTATLISKAVAVTVPVFPKKIPMTLLGMLAAFFLGIVVLQLSPKARIDEPEEIANRPANDKQKSIDEDLLGYGQSSPVEFGTRA